MKIWWKFCFSQVNDVNFENMSNDDAVRILREIVSKPGWESLLLLDGSPKTFSTSQILALHVCFIPYRPISLTVAKCWDPSPRSYFTIPRGIKTAESYTWNPMLNLCFLDQWCFWLHAFGDRLLARFCSLVLYYIVYLLCIRSFLSAEPVRPIDPAAWISHTTALSGPYPHYGTTKSQI